MKRKICYVLCGAFIFVSGCGQPGHRHEQNEIRAERQQVERATADLNEAVKATDESGWDAMLAYRQFCDSARVQLEACKAQLEDFKGNCRKYRRHPSRYRRRLHKFEACITELEQRLLNYTIKGKADWEDFTSLYLYDLRSLSEGIKIMRKKC